MPNEYPLAPLGYMGNEEDANDWSLPTLTRRLLGNKKEAIELGWMVKEAERARQAKIKAQREAERKARENDKATAAAPRGIRPFAPIAGAAGPAGATGAPMADMGLIRGADGNLRERNPQYDVGYMPPAIAPVPGQRALRAMERSAPSGVLVPRDKMNREYDVAQETGQRAAAFFDAPLPGDEGYAGEPILTKEGADVVIPRFTRPPMPSQIPPQPTAQQDREALATHLENAALQEALTAREINRVLGEPQQPADAGKYLVENLRQLAVPREQPSAAGALSPVAPPLATPGVNAPPSPMQMNPRPGGGGEDFGVPVRGRAVYDTGLPVEPAGGDITKFGEGAATRYVSQPSNLPRGVRIDPDTGKAVYESPDVVGGTRAGYGTTFDWATGKATTPAAGQTRRGEEIAAAKAETAAREVEARAAAKAAQPSQIDTLATRYDKAAKQATDAGESMSPLARRKLPVYQRNAAKLSGDILTTARGEMRKLRSPEDVQQYVQSFSERHGTRLGDKNTEALSKSANEYIKQLDVTSGWSELAHGRKEIEDVIPAIDKDWQVRQDKLATHLLRQNQDERNDAQRRKDAGKTDAVVPPLLSPEDADVLAGQHLGGTDYSRIAEIIPPRRLLAALKKAGVPEKDAADLAARIADPRPGGQRAEAWGIIEQAVRHGRFDSVAYRQQRAEAVTTAQREAQGATLSAPREGQARGIGGSTPAPAAPPVPVAGAYSAFGGGYPPETAGPTVTLKSGEVVPQARVDKARATVAAGGPKAAKTAEWLAQYVD